MWVGACFALLLGLALAPFSFIGAFFGGIGLLGFTPFLMAFVYWRNALEASNLADLRPRAVPLALLGAALPVFSSGAIHIGATRAFARGIERSLSDDAHEREAGIALLDLVTPLQDIDELVWLYEREEDPVRKERIAAAYERISGNSIEAKLNELRD
jgi:hypothetical protein